MLLLCKYSNKTWTVNENIYDLTDEIWGPVISAIKSIKSLKELKGLNIHELRHMRVKLEFEMDEKQSKQFFKWVKDQPVLP